MKKNLSIMRHTFALHILLIFFLTNGFAQAADQEDRISDMGFVSISDSEEEGEVPEEFIERRVPQPKVVNFPTEASNDFRSEDTSIRVTPQQFIRTDVDTVPGFYELGNPIVVGPDEEAFVIEPEEPEESMDSALEEEFMATAIEVLGAEKGDTVTRTATPTDMVVGDSKNGFYEMDESDGVATVGRHRKEAYNFYTYDRRDRKFFPWKFGGGRQNPFGITQKQQAAAQEATHKEVMRGLRSPTPTWDYESEEQKRGIPGIKAKVSLTQGYRQDDLDWNIASDITGMAEPNVLSELTWDAVQILETKARAEVVLLDRFVLDAKAGWGQIFSGENQDSDYLENNRSGEFSRSNNRTDDGEVWDYSIGAGYRFNIENPDWIFLVDDLDMTLLGGYSRHAQYLVITDLNQTIPDIGPIPVNLNSRYRARWDGPWVGFQLDGTRGDRLRGYGRFEYHFVDYVGDATWNLRESFQQPLSFTHFSNNDSYGMVFDFGGQYRLNPTWSLAVDLVYSFFHVGGGTDRTFFTNQTFQSLDTKINDVNWSSLSITGGAAANF